MSSSTQLYSTPLGADGAVAQKSPFSKKFSLEAGNNELRHQKRVQSARPANCCCLVHWNRSVIFQEILPPPPGGVPVVGASGLDKRNLMRRGRLASAHICQLCGRLEAKQPPCLPIWPKTTAWGRYMRYAFDPSTLQMKAPVARVFK